MCGICGIAAADPARAVDASTLDRMTEVIVHRGPDDDGTYRDARVGLGMRRLSIIDVEGGHQPISNERRTMHVVFNGELYNYRALRTQLAALGHSFETHSDTEVVVHAYEEWGTDCLRHFRGMFGLALWDETDQALLLAIDRFGIKPLYYADLGGDVVFGSELSCLLASGRLEKELDDAALAEYFTLGYIPPPATIFRDARKLEPGTFLRWTPRGGLRVERYWEVPEPRGDRGYQQEPLRRELRELLRDAVRSHLVADVPLGAFLSGGIDSSTVVALMSEVSDDPVKTFSIGFADADHDETHLARLVAKRYRTDHHELIVEPESIDILPKLVSHFHEPFADSSALPTYYVSKLARESVKVALSGDGGDELFVGYTTFRGVELARLAQTVPAPLRRAAAALPGRLPRRGARWNDRVARLSKIAADSTLSPDDAYRSKITMTGLPVVRPLLSPELRRRLDAQNPFRAVDAALASTNGASPLERVIHSGLKVSLPGDMLVKVDRMSMANSLEVRVPLLDHVLAEFVSQVPVSIRFPRWRLKGLLKDTMADALPREILERPKHGFVVPVSSWFRGDLAGFAREVLLSPEARARGLLDGTATERFLGEHLGGGRNLGSAIWSLLVFELWCRQILD